MSSDVWAFEVFQNNLEHLCLDNFPTGLGSWRADFLETIDPKSSCSHSKTWKPNIENYFQITLKDNVDANLEKTEALIELISNKKSPWNFTDDWSMEAKSLREICVKSPWLISRSFVHGHFKTLRLIDKQITKIDDSMAYLKNLEELTLSANYLTQISSKNLPESLKVLEVCANRINNLEGLIDKPPPLEHFGIGMNKLTSISNYITGTYWPSLISLDLSDNSLTEIAELTDAISTLPKLRCLIMKGNPFSLLPNYRGFVIDCLPGLIIFDDLRISADERFNFRGMSRKQELMTNEISIEMQVNYIKHLPVPEEVKNPADFPDLPIILRKYHLQFWWPCENAKTLIPPLTTRTLSDPMDNLQDEKLNVSLQPEVDSDEDIQQALEFALDHKEDVENGDIEDTHEISFTLEPMRSMTQNFAPEMMEYGWEQGFTRTNLKMFRDFLKQGIDIELIEDKMNMYPPNQLPQVEDPLGRKSPSAKHGGGGGSSKKGAAAATSTKGSNKDQGGAAGKNQNTNPGASQDKKVKKGKKVEESDLAMHSKVTTVLAKFHLPLESLLDTTTMIENVLVTEKPLVATPAMPDLKPDKKTKKQKGETEKAKKEKEKSNLSRPGTRGKASSKASKNGEKGKKQDSVEDNEVIPPPTEVSLSISLVKWSTTKEALKYVNSLNKIDV